MLRWCKNEDGAVAIGTGNRPIEHCRPCYIAAYGGEFIEVLVTIPWRDMGIDHDAMAIACAKTGEDIFEGGTAWLDPVETSILALVAGGLVQVVQKKKAPARAERATEV